MRFAAITSPETRAVVECMLKLCKAPDPGVPSELAVSVYVLIRLSVRLFILVLFALASRQGFGKALEGMLSLATFYCLIVATFRRESMLSPVLTHFDEAAGYAFIAAGLESLIA